MLTTAYSLYLKRIAVVDVLLLAGLYTLRVLAGIAAAQVRFSTWLLAFSMFLFLSLAFLKRYTEVSAMEGAATEQVRRRGYLRGDREWLGSMGGASGYLSVLVLALYINSEQVVALYRTPLLALARLPAAAVLDQPHVAAGPSRPDPRRPDRRHGARPGELRPRRPRRARAVPGALMAGAVTGAVRAASYRSWGRYPSAAPADVLPVVWRSDAPPLERLRGSVLPYACGRSYGDSCLNDGGAAAGRARGSTG